jgi:anti-anti-sigma factor
MNKGEYLYRHEGPRLFLKMKGNLKFTGSFGFDRLVDTLLDQELENVLIDLNEASYIDSTNLGIIARIAEELRTRDKRLTILSSNEDVNDILASVGFDKVALILKKDEEIAGLQKIKRVDLRDREMAESMIRAHKSLISLYHANKEVFQDVIELMETDIKTSHRE